MENVIDSWKNKNVFKKQLNLNLKELTTSHTYPEHWNVFIEFLIKNKPKSILDIGCGCGSYYELVRRFNSEIKYVGIDYSEDAIELAKNHWNHNDFYVKSYTELTPDYISNFDLVHMGALLDVLPNADEVLDFILSLSAKSVIIGRVKLTNKPSYYDVYTAYDEIKTYAYYHNLDNFYGICKKNGYKILNNNNNFYLTKENGIL